MDRGAAFDIVYAALDSVNELRAAKDRIERRPDVVLVGDDGALDSLALTTLVLGIERKIDESEGISLDLISASLDENMSGFRTPESIVDLIMERVGG